MVDEQQKNTAAFVPAYGLRLFGKMNECALAIPTLTAMSRESIEIAARLFRYGAVDYVIVSAAYEYAWRREARLKKDLLVSLGVDPEKIFVIEAVTNTYNEVAGAKRFVDRLKIRTFILIADKWHAPRAEYTLHRFFPMVEVCRRAFSTPRYEMTEEPSIIKRIRSRVAPLWIAWNLAFRVVTPLAVAIQQRR